jgi:TctA family transporter
MVIVRVGIIEGIAVLLSGGSPLKGSIMLLVLFSNVGIGLISGQERFTFNRMCFAILKKIRMSMHF